jgi:hypothetical protein
VMKQQRKKYGEIHHRHHSSFPLLALIVVQWLSWMWVTQVQKQKKIEPLLRLLRIPAASCNWHRRSCCRPCWIAHAACSYLYLQPEKRICCCLLLSPPSQQHWMRDCLVKLL